MHNRLKQFLAAENITQAQFADRIRIGKANVSHVLAGRNKPGYDFITAIMAGFPQLNINWLFFGNGKMYNNSQSVPQSAEPSVNPDSDLLFSDFYDEPAEEPEIRVLPEKIVENIPAIDSNKIIDNTTQTIAKQRVVKKIIVLFDDGTFQEL